ncbi:MAG: flippase-like domain-containing protein [Candidatus Hydrogenedentes bacterium]|nr:flippase-like domain-containing protein [Candidatus Hydrogenedentota bacterium]
MKRTIQIVVSLVLAGVLAWVLFRGVRWSELYASIRKVDLFWLLLLQIPVWASFWLRILRWKYIVRAVHPATFRSMFSATQLGFLVNFIIGLRLGEFVRAIVLSRLSRVTFAKSLALATLDRVSDLIGLLVVMIVAAFAFRPTGDIVVPPGTFGIEQLPPIPATAVQTAGITAAIGLSAILVILVALYLNQGLVFGITRATVGRVSKRLSDWLCSVMEQFAEGLHVFRSASDMLKSTTYSLITWGCFVVALAGYLKAFGLDAPWYAPFVIQAFLAFGVSVPAAPGIGMLVNFSYPIVASLLVVVPNVTLADATALALVAYVCNLLPIIILGIVCLHLEGLSFFELSRESVQAEDAAPEEA